MRHPEIKVKTSSQTLSAAFGPSIKDPEVALIPLHNPSSKKTKTIPCAIVLKGNHPTLILTDEDRKSLGIPWPGEEVHTTTRLADQHRGQPKPDHSHLIVDYDDQIPSFTQTSSTSATASRPKLRIERVVFYIISST
jgi:hypothetical protein